MSSQSEKFTDWKGILIGLLIAIAFGLGGFFSLSNDKGAMGLVLFLLLPSASGFAVAVVAKPGKIANVSIILGTIFCLSMLLISGIEGLVCVVMASPLIAAGLALGALGGHLFRKHVIDKSKMPQVMKLLVLLIAPLLLMGAKAIEQPVISSLRTETFVTRVIFKAKPEQVWDTIKSVEKINAEKPLLLRIGLPVPERCELEGEGVGSKRICYFDVGHIEERVTEWNPPTSMKMEVTEFQLPGSRWLGFKDASYEMHQEGDNTVVTRETTITSRLYPAWYWRPLEKFGVESEHDYLFNYVRTALNVNK